MVIGGHVVKTSNNYVVTGVDYVHGAYPADVPREKKKPRPPPVRPSAANGGRAMPEHVARRSAHNDAIRARMTGPDESARLDFMAENAGTLHPFVDEKVRARLACRREGRQLPVAAAAAAANKKGRGGEKQPGGGGGGKGDEHRPPMMATQPDIVVTPLRDYQMIGLEWMASMHSRGMPFVLGDEMGLGKTLQTIALIAHLKEDMGYSGPSLVVCPLSVLYSWCAELDRHAPSLRHFRFHSSDEKEREAQKRAMLHDVLSYDVVVTTYEMVKNPALHNLISKTYFNLCVLDEGHVIKSMTSQVGESVRRVHCQTRVVLTGTPLQNNLVELYAILNYLYPQYFTTPDKFESAFDIGHNRIDPDMLLSANRLLKLFMIRRLKDEVEKLMPKKIETKVRA
jgi:SWI/SNF-related matrix-associated actin-dependent regulator of chromatin subfamily A member 5